MAFRNTVNITLFALSLVITLLSGEVLARVYFSATSKPSLGELSKHLSQTPQEYADLGDLLQLSASESLIYELKPNLNTSFLGAALTTNHAGFRGDMHRFAKEQGQIRIVGIGDSLMFGWGIPDGGDYLSRLAKKLNEGLSQQQWEIVNTSVPGYNTQLEVETLKLKGLKYHPDYVVLGFVQSNDLELPHFVFEKPDYFSLRISFFNSFILSRLRGDAIAPPSSRIITPTSKARRTFKRAHGYEMLSSSLEELRNLGHQYGFRTVVYAHERITNRSRKIFSDAGVDLIEAWPVLLASIHTERLSDYRKSPFVLSEGDPHPSALGHQLAAELLFHYFGNASRTL